MSSPRTGSRFRGSRCRRTVEAVAGLAVLLGSLALPLLGLVRADEPVPFCCRGRCCCTGESTDDGDGRPCLRQRCGCGEPDAVVIAASLRLEAVLPAVAVPSRADACWLGRCAEPASPRNPPHAPPVPPPERPLPA